MPKKPHTPHHIFIDNIPYFISSAIYQKRLLLASNKIKNYLLQTLKQSFTEKGWQLTDWVILDNHYHLMVKSNQGKALSRILSKIHMQTAQLISTELQAKKPIWWNYWDYSPRDESDYFVRLNYLYNNPIKHGYVTNLADYPYSSFHQMLKQHGRDSLVEQFKTYPDYKQLTLDEDIF